MNTSIKTPSFALISRVLFTIAVVLTLGAAGWGLFVSFVSPLSTETKEDTLQEVALVKIDLAKHLGEGKTLSKILDLNTEFDVTFVENYVKLNEDCIARSRTKEYSYAEDYKENEAVNNPFSPRGIVGPDNGICQPR